MDTDARNGKTEPSMKATGSSTKRAVEASSGTLTVTFSKENG